MGDRYEAAPVSRATLEEVGWKVRETLNHTQIKWLPVARVIEHLLPMLYGDNFTFRVGDLTEMGSNHGFADPEGPELVLREDIYEGMVDGVGRDRMTAIHEMSHLILHQKVRLHRRMSTERIPAYRDPEWQAKCLAGTIMMPAPLMSGYSRPEDVARHFGVSEHAARIRLNQVRRSPA